MNPVRAGLAERAEQWRWSSFAELKAGVTSELVDDRRMLSMLGRDPADARALLLDLVAEASGLPTYDPTRLIYGDAEFVKHHAPATPPQQPVARAAWNQARPTLEDLVARYPRDEAMRVARAVHRYTIKEIAQQFGCSPETVRRRLRMWDVRT